MCNKRTATYCLSVPLFVHFSFSPMEKFFVKDFSATTWVRILKFGTKLDSDELYCVTKEQPHIAYQSLYLFIFLSLQWNFCHRFLSSYWRQCFQILFTSSGWQSVLCKWKLKNSHILLISPFICSFFFLSNGNFCHRFLSSYWSQCFQILFTSSGWQSVLCKWKLRC